MTRRLRKSLTAAAGVRSTAANVRALWSGEVISLLLTSVQGIVIARALGAQRFGTYAVLVTFTGFVFLLLDPRTAEAVVKFLSEARAEGDAPRARAVVRAAFVLDSCWALASFAAAVGAGPLAQRLFGYDAGILLLTLVALGSAAAAPAATSRGILTVLGRFRLVAGIQGAVSLARFAAVCGVALTGGSLVKIAGVLTLVALVDSTIVVPVAVHQARREFGGPVLTARLDPLSGCWRSMGRFIVLSDLTSLVATTIKQVDVLIVAAVAGPQQAGYFRLAKSLTGPASNVAGPVQAVLYPKISQAVALQEYAEVKRLAQTTVRRLGLPLAAITLAAIPLVQPAVVLLAGPDFEPASGIAQVLLIGTAAAFLTLHVRPLYLSLNEVKALFWFSTAISTACLVAFLLVAPWWEALGVAWARTIILSVGVLLLQLWIKRRIEKDVNLDP